MNAKSQFGFWSSHYGMCLGWSSISNDGLSCMFYYLLKNTCLSKMLWRRKGRKNTVPDCFLLVQFCGQAWKVQLAPYIALLTDFRIRCQNLHG